MIAQSYRLWIATCLTLFLGLLFASPETAAVKRAFTIEDFYRARSPQHPDLSPDGKSIVYSLRSLDLPRAKTFEDLYRVPTEGGEPVRLTWTDDASESSPSYAPDGKSIVFVAERGEQDHSQLWLLPASGGEARPLTDLATDVSDPVWSPDGKHVAFTATVYPQCGADMECHGKREAQRSDGPLEAHVADELLYRHWNSWIDGAVTHILVVEVESGTVRDLTPGDRDAPAFSLGGPPGFAFSPDSKELCFTRNPDPVESLAWSTNSDLWVVPVEPDDSGRTQSPRNLTVDNPALDTSPSYSPDGRYIAYRRQARPGYESDLIQLAVIDRSNDTSRIVTRNFQDWVEEIHWAPDSKSLVFTAPHEGQTPLHRVSVDGGPVSRIAEFANLDSFALTEDGRRAYVVRRAIDQPREIWALELDGKTAPRRLTEHNLELETEVDIRPAESIWVASGDRQIQVFVIKPHGFEDGKRYPLILNVHGGPQGMWGDAFRGDWQVYPGAGYVVAFANPHGSTGYGQAFTEQISGDWGGRVFDDLMRVTDALEKLPYVDSERMGAMGWSYGGYMMNWFQGHTGRFKALANMMGLFDLRSFYYATEELWFPEWDLGGTPWSSDLYERWNPAASAERFNTPMLIVTGEKDYRVPYTQSLMAFTAMRRRGIPARLVVLPRAGHWPGWYEMALYYSAHLDWFHRYLGGDAAPWSVNDFARNAVFDPETGKRVDLD